MAESYVSSTNGGIDFESFCKSGIQSYTFNPVNLADDKNEKGTERKMDRDIKKLSERLKQTIQDYETQDIDSERRVHAYYIGKTYLKRKKRQGKGFQIFDRMDPKTWIKSGISSRYRAHKMKKYGQYGLVVLGVVTKDILPETRAKRIKQEDYALILEQRLVHHQLIEEADDRLVNKTFNEGRRQTKDEEKIDERTKDEQNAYAYAIYMTLGSEEQPEQVHDVSTCTCTEETGDTARVPLQVSKISKKKDTKRSSRRKKEPDIDKKQMLIPRFFGKEKRKVTFSL